MQGVGMVSKLQRFIGQERKYKVSHERTNKVTRSLLELLIAAKNLLHIRLYRKRFTRRTFLNFLDHNIVTTRQKITQFALTIYNYAP